MKNYLSILLYYLHEWKIWGSKVAMFIFYGKFLANGSEKPTKQKENCMNVCSENAFIYFFNLLEKLTSWSSEEMN